MPEAENNDARGLTRRSFLTDTATSLVGLMLGAGAAGQQPLSKTYGFINGNCLDGQRFENKRFYSVKGVFTAQKPVRVDAVVVRP